MIEFELLKNDKLQQLKKLLEKNNAVCVKGLNVGEKAFVAGVKQRAIIVVPDLISANQYNSQLLSLGFKSQIIMRGFDTPLFVYATRAQCDKAND